MPQNFDEISVKSLPVADNIYVLVGAGGNIGVSVGPDGILLVDNQYTPLYGKIMDALRKLSDQPIRFVVNTHFHGDHIGGNAQMAKNGAVIVGHDNLRKRLIENWSNPIPNPRNPPVPPEALPIVTYSDSITFHFNGDDVFVFHPGPAHSAGDSVIYFRRANVIHVGDIVSAGRYPVFVAESGGSTDGMIAAMEQILNIANPSTRIIPGHGPPPTTMQEVQDTHDMLVAVRNRVFSAMQAGKTLEQIIAAKPTAEFDARFGGGTRSPDDFVTMVYRGLAK